MRVILLGVDVELTVSKRRSRQRTKSIVGPWPCGGRRDARQNTKGSVSRLRDQPIERRVDARRVRIRFVAVFVAHNELHDKGGHERQPAERADRQARRRREPTVLPDDKLVRDALSIGGPR